MNGLNGSAIEPKVPATQPIIDLFLCHNGADKDWVEKLAEQVESLRWLRVRAASREENRDKHVRGTGRGHGTRLLRTIISGAATICRPAAEFMTITRSEMASASSWSCVTYTDDTPSRCWSSFSSTRIFEPEAFSHSIMHSLTAAAAGNSTNAAASLSLSEAACRAARFRRS